MKNFLFTFLCVAAFLVTSCNDKSTLTADEIINKSIAAHGADLLEQSSMEFTFRGLAYVATRDNGAFEYKRTKIMDSITLVDRLDNKGHSRFINEQQQSLPDSLSRLYKNSVNSVIYFAQLPYSLNGAAVYRELIGEKLIKDKSYYKVKITFDPNGGGEAYEDEFIYWINKQSFLVDYLAYSFCEDVCGYRFRESVNRRTIQGVTIQDYNNYKEKVEDPDLAKMDEFLINNQLELLSTIETKDVILK